MVTSRRLCLRHPRARGCLTVMEGYAANKTKHCIRGADVSRLSVSIMLRKTLGGLPPPPSALPGPARSHSPAVVLPAPAPDSSADTPPALVAAPAVPARLPAFELPEWACSTAPSDGAALPMPELVTPLSTSASPAPIVEMAGGSPSSE